MRFVLLTLFLLSSVVKIYAQDFYDLNKIQKIEVHISDAQWRLKLDSLKAGIGGYLMADSVFLNDSKFENVGFKFKGNSSYNPAFNKNPFHIELNTFQTQNYQGYQDIKLSNGFGDPSFVREALSYHILGAYMDAPKCNFAELYINQEYLGLYTNTESINRDFISNKFGSKSKTFIKGEAVLSADPANKSNLKYLGSDSNLYFPFYKLESESGWQDLIELCDTLNNKPQHVDAVLDIDKAIWMLAFNALLVNLDSYSGAYCQNYYLYHTKAGKFVPIVWDLNRSFGAFPLVGEPNNGPGNLLVSEMQQLAPNVHATHADWPLIQAVFANQTYRKSFYAHLKTMLYNHFDTGYYKQVYRQMQNLVAAPLQADTNRFFSLSDFQNAADSTIRSGNFNVPGVFQLMDQRITYLKSLPELNAVAPQITEITISAQTLTWNQNFWITAQSQTGLNTVYCHYKRDKWEHFTRQQMFDDGKHGDGAAGDGVYGAGFTMSTPYLYYYVYAENSQAASFSPQRAAFDFYTLQVNVPNLEPGVLVINEFLASNKKSDINEYGAYEDWIELHNNSTEALDLSGFQISDNMNNPDKFVFPIGTSIGPKGYLMLWADDMPSTARFLHTGFALSASGEELILSNTFGKVLDSITFGIQETDKSTGRCPNGTGKFTQISRASFNDANIFCATGLTGLEPNMPAISVYPNPSNGELYLHNPMGINGFVEVFDLQGKRVYWSLTSTPLLLYNLQPACYFVVFKNNDGSFVGSQKLILNR